jgi:hypothetical protein
MIQHVGVTPIIKDADLGQHLVDLRFEAISERFGLFFLHNLDVTNGDLPEIPEGDSKASLAKMGITAQKKKAKVGIPKSQTVQSQEALTWASLNSQLNHRDSTIRIREFVWDPLWLAYCVAEDIFCQFTHQYWMVNTPQTFRGLTEVPATLEVAMELWSLNSIKERMNQHEFDTRLIPSADGLQNVPPKSRTQVFSRKRTAFFPEPDQAPNPRSHWTAFYNSGYVMAYHRMIKKSSDEGKALRDSLDGIFEHLQVLPHNPGRPDDVKQLWRWEGQSLKLLLNSSYIQLTDRKLGYKEGTGKEQRQGGKHKARSKTEMKILLVGKMTYDPLKKTRAIYKSTAIETKQLMQGRRGRGTNHQKPPTKRSKVVEHNQGLSDHGEGEQRDESCRQPSRVVELDEESPLERAMGESAQPRGGRRGRGKNYRKPPTKWRKAVESSDEGSPLGRVD